MKLLVVSVLLALAASAPRPAPGGLRVVVTGMESDRGAVRVALFDSEASFTRDAREAAVLPIRAGQAEWTVRDLPPGRYAVAAFHDEDGDGDMDRGLFGIPREPYGFSRGARGRFGPPSWEAASVRVGAGVTTTRVPVR